MKSVVWFLLISVTHVMFVMLLILEIIPQHHYAGKIAAGTVGAMVLVELFRGFKIKRETAQFNRALEDARLSIDKSTNELMIKVSSLSEPDSTSPTPSIAELITQREEGRGAKRG